MVLVIVIGLACVLDPPYELQYHVESGLFESGLIDTEEHLLSSAVN